jgi:hypothetical protein
MNSYCFGNHLSLDRLALSWLTPHVSDKNEDFCNLQQPLPIMLIFSAHKFVVFWPSHE